jgi:hydrogenase maturation factor
LVRIDIDQAAKELSVSLVKGDTMPLKVRGKSHVVTSAAIYRTGI